MPDGGDTVSIIKTKDLTFRRSTAGAWTLASPAEFVLSTVQRLLYMKPGSDIYNASMGLDAVGRSVRSYVEGSRDTEFETRMVEQLQTYTDIVPLAVVAVYHDSLMEINLTATYDTQEYRLIFSVDPNTLSNMITRV